MRSIPNFAPRSHGIVLIHRQEYTAKDCDCRYCSHYSGRGRKTGCILDRCECVAERIIAGTATYRETAIETMSAIRYTPLVRRINQLRKESEKTPMDYRNEKHRIVFAETIKRMNRKNKILMATLYLLTDDYRLWKTSKPFTEQNQYERRPSKGLRHPSLCGKGHVSRHKNLTVDDLADTELIPPKQFALICNAMAIRRSCFG